MTEEELLEKKRRKSLYDYEYCRDPERRAKKRQQVKDWKIKNPRKYENSRLKTRYGISIDELEEMIEKRNSQCEICEKQTNLVVDHCHDTGIVRGLLCLPCNQALGKFGDKADGVRRAVRYLEKFEASLGES